MQASALIGNDVVDLTLKQTQNKVDDLRFVNRVCASEEQAILAQSNDPNRTLWCLWSAKETAFKIVLKRWPGTKFHHSKFVVSHPPLFERGQPSDGWASFEDMRIPLRWQVSWTTVHCFGVWSKAAIPLDEVDVAVAHRSAVIPDDGGFSDLELQSIRSDESKQVRWLAKQLLGKRGYTSVEIIRERAAGHWKAPRIWHRGKRLLESGLSLSHHGQFRAAAVWVK